MASQEPDPIPTAHVVAVLQKLNTPSTDQVREAEAAISNILSQPQSLQPLVQILVESPDPYLRHLAAVLLRRVLRSHWQVQSDQTRQATKHHLLGRLSTEQSPGPRRGLTALCAAICTAEDALWPELTTAAMQLASSQDPMHRKTAFSVFHSLSDALPSRVVPHVPAITQLLSTGLADPVPLVRAAALNAFEASANAAAVFEGDSLTHMAPLIPNVVAVAQQADDRASDDFGRMACSVFDVLTLMCEANGGTLMRQYFADATRFALDIFSNSAASGMARSAAIEFCVFAVQHKPKTLRKIGLGLQAVQTACKVVFQNSSHAGDSEAFGHDNDDADDDEVNAINLALRLLDTIARRKELSKLTFAEVMTIVMRTYESDVPAADPAQDGALAAGYRIIGTIAEGCSVETTAHAQVVVKRLASGAMESNSSFSTRARSLQALGLVCDALDTDEMPDDVTDEVANTSLSALLFGMRDPQLFVRKHACMALEATITLFNGSGDGVRNRVGEVIEALGGLGVDAAVEAVMAVGVLAEHAAEAFSSSAMYKDVIEGTIRLMNQTEEKDYLARAAALEAAGALVSACKDRSVIEKFASHAIHGLEVEEPAVKQATFSFFARMADAVGGSVVTAFGPQILAAAIESMEREDIMFVREDDDDDEPRFGGEDEDDDRPGTFQVRTAYLDEKMVATACVGAFASAAATDGYVTTVSASLETASTVRSRLLESIKIIDDLCSYFHEDVRAAAYRAAIRIAATNIYFVQNHASLALAGKELLDNTFSRISYALTEDDDTWVVTSVLNSAAGFIRELPPEAVNEHKAGILGAVHKLIAGEATCQMCAEDEEEEFEVEESDGDEVGGLIEGVGDMIEALAYSLRGYFAKDFEDILKAMLRFLYSKNASSRNKGMVLGSVAGVLLFLNWDRCSEVTPPAKNSPEYEIPLATSDDTAAAVLPLALLAVTSTESKTLQRNAVFLIGIVFLKTRASKSDVWQQLPRALMLFQQILQAGKTGDGALVDNAAGSVARIMCAKGLPAGALGDTKVVLQAVLGAVPLEDDPTENVTIARTLIYVAEKNFDLLLDEGIVNRVASCLVSAVLLCAEQQREKTAGQRPNPDADLNDKMVGLDEAEVLSLRKVLSLLHTRAGNTPFANLNLSQEDQVVLGELIKV